jgi:hypothetical protein
MSSLFYMAMNPNLTAEQFKELSEKHIEAQKKCYLQISEAMDRMPSEQATQFLMSVLPLMIGW